MGDLVDLPGDGATAGYLATGEGAGPGVLVLHQRGPTDHVADVCDRLAGEGFTALAPALPDDRTLPADPMRVAEGVSGAVDHLQAHPAVRGRGIGVIGFSVGAGVALCLASIRPDRVRAVVPFYGVVPWGSPQPDWSAMTASVEGHYAEHDDLAGPGGMAQLEQVLVELGLDVRMFLYPATAPGFFEDDTSAGVYDDDAARQAWVRTLEFLRAKLG